MKKFSESPADCSYQGKITPPITTRYTYEPCLTHNHTAFAHRASARSWVQQPRGTRKLFLFDSPFKEKVFIFWIILKA